MSKIILDLCGGTGAWSRPYTEAGYDVRVVTLPEQDVRLFQHIEGVHGILAAPPCTYFCTMRNCRGLPTPEQYLEGLSVVDACLRIIWACQPRWWALENPSGSLYKWLGRPMFKFQPNEFGDPWTKQTWIWGQFAMPLLSPSMMEVEPTYQFVSSGRTPGEAHNARERSITPPGFARAFFKANP